MTHIYSIGLNMTTMEFSDGSIISKDIFDYNGDFDKLVQKDCIYAKRGIWYKIRGTDCRDLMNYYCLWTRKFFKTSFIFKKYVVIIKNLN